MIAIATLALTVLFGLASSGMAGELCLLPSAANGLNVSVKCIEYETYENKWSGFRSGGGVPCNSGYYYCFFDDDFAWTISVSFSDPLQNQTSLPLGTGQLYLWFYCTAAWEGFAAAEFDVGGSIAVHSFTPLNGFLNAGDATQLRLVVGGCPSGPILAGTFQVHDPIAVDAATWGGIKSTYR